VGATTSAAEPRKVVATTFRGGDQKGAPLWKTPRWLLRRAGEDHPPLGGLGAPPNSPKIWGAKASQNPLERAVLITPKGGPKQQLRGVFNPKNLVGLSPKFGVKNTSLFSPLTKGAILGATPIGLPQKISGPALKNSLGFPGNRASNNPFLWTESGPSSPKEVNFGLPSFEP